MNIKNKTNAATIYLDMKNNTVSFYMVNASGHIIHDGRKITERFLSNEYYDHLTNILKEFVQKYTPANASNTTILLPDSCVFNNTVSFPTQKGGESKNAYAAYITNTFKNAKDLIFDVNKAVTNKQFTTLCLTGIKKEIIASLKIVFQNARLAAQNITFVSSALLAGLNTLSAKYKGQSFMYLDMKDTSSKYIFVHKGKPIGTFDLPIGYNILVEKLAAEDVLLYSPQAELVVVNAKEKAIQKALTMSGADNAVEQGNSADEFEDEETDNAFSGSDNLAQAKPTEIVKVLPKKVARKLPKFMIREIPEESERKIYENFRIFMRWALDILENNNRLTSITKISTVYVNMPSELSFLFDIANEEEDENGVKFTSAGLGKEKEEVVNNLEMFGGLFAKDYKQSILF